MATNEQYRIPYTPIPKSDVDLERKAVNVADPLPPGSDQRLATQNWRFFIMHLLLLGVWITLIASRLPALWTRTSPDSTAPWSPLSDLLRYENQIFHTGFKNDLTEYQGAPNDQNEKAWEDLTKGKQHRSPNK